MLNIMLLIAAGLPTAADTTDPLAGTWVILSAERGGKAMDQAKGSLVVCAGGEMIIRLEQSARKGTYKIDPARTPKTIDLVPGDGPLQGKTLKGIYELNKDEWSLCYREGDGARPTEFVTKEGTNVTLVVLRREKK